jgi:hypothetical protein
VLTSGSPATIGTVTERVWGQFAAEEPGADFTRIYPFIAEADRERAVTGE